MAENKILKEHPLLERINTVRAQLAGTDRDDHLKELIAWEARAKAALIFLNLQGHEGIQMIIDKAKEEIAYRRTSLKTRRPEDMSPEGMHRYATDRALDFLALDMWVWFLHLFVDAENSVIELESILAEQDLEEEDSYEGEALEVNGE